MIFVFGNFSAETWNIYFGIMEAHYWTNGSLRAEYTALLGPSLCHCETITNGVKNLSI
jgi:hypothetical protein